MKEPINSILRNKLICALAEIRFGNIGKAKKHIRSALMIMDDTLEMIFINGTAQKEPAIADGEYKVFVDDIHLLTKKIKGNEGSNHLPWLTRVKLLAWKGLVAKYRLFTGDFVIEWSEPLKCWLLIYKDGRIIDRVRFVRGQNDTLVGCFYYKDQLEFWFLMRKV